MYVYICGCVYVCVKEVWGRGCGDVGVNSIRRPLTRICNLMWPELEKEKKEKKES